MPIEQYFGRLNDIVVLHGAKASGRQRLRDNLSENEICTGVQKVTQSAVLLLLTEQGSDRFDLEAGTGLMTAIRGGRVTSDMDFQIEFNHAAGEVIRQLQNSEVDATPAEERLRGLELLEFAVTNGVISAVIQVVTAAGTERTVILPIGIPMR